MSCSGFSEGNPDATATKVAESGFTPVETPFGTVAYAEASLVMSCKKLYAGQLVKDNILDQIARTTMYAPDEEAHQVFIAEITGVWKRNA